MKIGWQTLLTSSYTTDVENVLGALRYENKHVYRWVKNNESATALTVGQVCGHVLSEGVDMDKKVTIPATAGLMAVAGVIMATSGIAAGSYGWILVRGTGSISVSGATTGGTNIAAGDYLKAVNAAAYAVRDAASPPTYRRTMQTLTAVATTTTPAAALVAGEVFCL